MGVEKQGSKGVGGFLQMFDWNAKSRKKLFSSKSNEPERSKQKKRFDGNLPSTSIQMLEGDEITAVSSVKESSDYSCSSSLVDEDFYSKRAPGVVARLMGLDSLPKSTQPFDSQSLDEVSSYYYQAKNLDYHRQDQIFKHSGNLHDLPARNDMSYPIYHHRNVMNGPIEKFQTEILPPKSAKSILRITNHKILSPIRNGNFTSSKDPGRIMEEASARIIEPGHRASGVKTKLPPVRSSSSSSIPLRVVDFKEKTRSARKPLEVFEGSQRKPESQSGVRTNNNKGKSVSLALQAKANVLKREGMNASSSRTLVSPKERCEPSSNNSSLFKSQPVTQKNTLKKNHTENRPSVLRQNNQKQNSIVDRGKIPAKCNSKGPKNKLEGMSSKVSSKKLGPEIKDDKRKAPSSSSSSERVINRKKRPVDECEKNQPLKNSSKTDRLISKDRQDRVKTGTDVISFTFNAPMTRSGPGSVGPTECEVFSSGSSQSKMSALSSDGTSGSRFSYAGHNNMKGGDALSSLLEQKLRELAQTVEFSQQKSGSAELEGDEMEIDNPGVLEESSASQASKSLDCRLPSPVSVLELSPFAESCNSSDTADSNSMGDSKQCSSVQAQELLDSFSSKMFLTSEGDIELSDSASSNSTNSKKSKEWELEYVNEILFNIEPMFEDYYASGRAEGVVKSHVFDKLECQEGYISNLRETPRTDKRLMFDCVRECLDLRCKQYVSGGCKQWAKGISVIKRKEKLAEEVYKEIIGWSAALDSMIDELVDKDMSGRYGKWVDYDIEAFELGIQIESRILNSLIDEVVADILVL
ncbi:hypothetical protein CASFOL_012719 [Castilleja foliolosa]|uniref:DUF4378 domain-containing protein n=1 Tax=Castilleja foliolosa TaxID=1961234 RepID=A0ABD3DLN4_9LAMI